MAAIVPAVRGPPGSVNVVLLGVPKPKSKTSIVAVPAPGFTKSFVPITGASGQLNEEGVA